MSFMDESLAFDASGDEREGRARREEKATDSLDFGDGISMTCAEMAAELNATARRRIRLQDHSPAMNIGPKRTSVLRRLNRPATFRMIPPLTSGSGEVELNGRGIHETMFATLPEWTSSSRTSASGRSCAGR